jgi:hypothetical protein
MKLSFDYDSTLDQEHVQEFAKNCIEEGHEVWIVTSRLSEKYISENSLSSQNSNQNEDIYKTADLLGIPKERIIFMNYQDKSEFLNEKDFVFHLDDDTDVLLDIDFSVDDCQAIDVKHPDWKSRCKTAIYKKEIN